MLQNKINSIVIVTLNFITIVFSNNSSPVYNQCGSSISKYQFILQSFGYPNGYPKNVNCEYTLIGHHSCVTEFHFQFLDFNLSASPNCNDYLEVSGYEKLCGFLTGIRMYRIKANSNLKLKFISKNETSSKGFQLVITRLPCTTNSKLNTTFSAQSITPNLGYSQLPKCCADSYNSRKFYLSSPGFPNSNQHPTECIYNIYRANPNICRLRINFKFFSVGFPQNNNCEYGYLEIDNKKICGCQTELNVISQFDQFWGDNPKILKYKNTKHLQNGYNGFALEITQDECPTRYSPGDININRTNKQEKVPQFYYYNDQLNRIKFPENTASQTEILTSKSQASNKLLNYPTLIDYYFFKAPDYTDDFHNNEREEREFIDTSDINFNLNKKHDETCENWGYHQYRVLTNEVLWKKMTQCHVYDSGTNCYDVKLPKGILLSPDYPFFYPANTNCCYRFHKLDGYCSIEFSVLDFNLEASYNCDKDYFMLYDKYKYCGDYLHGKHFEFDLKSHTYEDIKFKTDNYYCGRGFKIYFQHIPCKTILTTQRPISPSMTTTEDPIITQPPPPVGRPCGGDIWKEIFDLEISNINDECVFVVQKYNENVCGLEISLINLDISCDNEYLLINDKLYCSKMSGQTVSVAFNMQNTVTIAYRRRSEYRPVLSSIILRGQQIADNCDPFLEIPAQRRLKVLPQN